MGDAVVVERMKVLGAVILGTTNCPEFLMAYRPITCSMGRRAIRGAWRTRRRFERG